MVSLVRVKFLKFAFRIHHQTSVSNGADIRMRFKRGYHVTQFILRPPIVAIEESDDFAAAFGNAVVEGGGLAAVWLAQDADLRLKFTQNFRGAVRGAVVYNQDFAVGRGKILCQHALHRFFNEAFVVIGIDQYADKRCRHQQSTAQSLGLQI